MEPLKKNALEKASRMVIKIGSNLVTNNRNDLINKDILNNIAEEINSLHIKKKEVMLVSSGAVSLGRKALNLKSIALSIEEKQAAASIGQIILINAWKDSFDKFNIHCGQILLSHRDAELRINALNARNTLEELIKYKSIPIINENDTVATQELKYGDNDQLAARVAQISSANLLILLSDVDGLYSSNPINNPSAILIEKIEKITEKIESIADDTHSEIAVGGMKTKIKAAKIAMAAGCNMIITNGNIKYSISKVLNGGKSTWFIANANPKNARKKWISSQLEVSGNIIVDEGAKKALQKGASLLPAGVLSVDGNFEKGDSVNVFNKNGEIICVGLSSYPSSDIKKIIGQKSSEFKKLIGYHARDVIIHRDDLVLKE